MFRLRAASEDDTILPTKVNSISSDMRATLSQRGGDFFFIRLYLYFLLTLHIFEI